MPATLRFVSAIVLLCALAVGVEGCGYSTTSKSARAGQMKTLAIPAFVNQTRTYKIEQTITEAVVREFVSRSRFNVVPQDSTDADATLHGTILSAEISPLAYDSQTGRASSALVTVTMHVTLTDKTGRTIYENPNYIFRDQYQVSRELSSFFEEESPAVERLSRDVARTLVADVLENY